jgi:hypothetical protein
MSDTDVTGPKDPANTTTSATLAAAEPTQSAQPPAVAEGAPPPPPSPPGPPGSGQPPGGGTPPPNSTTPRSEEERRRDELIFWSDLNEVYLLLDFVSGRPQLNFDRLTMQDPQHPDDNWPSGRMIYEISQIRYPPPPAKEIDASDAAVVLVAKDQLSRIAAPARAQTIAYTALFVVAEGGWRRSAARRPAARRSHAAAPVGAENAATISAGPDEPEERDAVIRVAQETFPHLQRHARRFKHLRTLLIFGGLITLLLTALTSWDVAFGRATLQRLDQLTQDRDKLLQTNTQLLESETCPRFKPEDREHTEPDAQNPPNWTGGTNASGCFQLWYIDKRTYDARLDLARLFQCEGRWCIPYIHVFHWAAVLCGSGGSEPAATGSAGRTSVTWQTATTVVMVFTTYILPILFGLLGTVIGALRSIYNKVRDGELAPRDFGLTLLGLPLGATAGLVVGLFFSPSTAPIQGAAGVAGDLSLTASGLGFIAGFGCQSFFKFLEELIGRAFPENGPALGSTPSAGPSRG